MSDRYIDHDETIVYGAHASMRIRSHVKGLIKAFDPALEYMAAHLDAASKAVADAVASAREAEGDVRHATKAKAPALSEGIALLGRFSNHLDGHKDGVVDRKDYFVTDGTAGGVGKSAVAVLSALTHLSVALKKKGSPVRDASGWQKEVQDAMKALAPIVAHAEDAKTSRPDATPEVEAARTAWLQLYQSSKCSVESVLRLTGKMHLMTWIFHDLAVPGGTKVTTIPDAPPPAPPA
jgi:hypothetical protein